MEMLEEDTNIHCECSPVAVTKYRENTDQTPTELIVSTVGEVAGIDPIELPPLYEFVDPDTIETLLEGQNGQTLIAFQFDAWNVFVRGDGTIQVCKRGRPTDPKPIFGNTAGKTQ